MKRATVFSAALLLRLLAGWIFFGSVDVVNSGLNSQDLLSGKAVSLPYFPLINTLLWAAGVVAARFSIPLVVATKFAPVLFDALLATLLYELTLRAQPKMAFRTGMLYALSPLALMNVSFHGQWDSIALFFLLLAFGVRETSGADWGKELLFGCFFALSLMAKPIALPFLAIFLRRGVKALAPLAPAVAGFGVTGFLGCAVAYTYGYSVQTTLLRIVGYGFKGIQLFGLPYAPLFQHLPLNSIRVLWLAPAMVAAAVLYYKGKLSWAETMLGFYLFTLATSGLSPQYLLWPLPFLLLCGQRRLAAGFSFVATAFLVLWYANPWPSYYPFENMATLVPLRGFAWLAPPASLMGRAMVPLINALGNIGVPLTAVVTGVLFLRSRFGLPANAPAVSTISLRTLACYALPALALALGIFTLKLTVNTLPLRAQLASVWKAQPRFFAMHTVPQTEMQTETSPRSVILIPDSQSPSPLNICVLLFVMSGIWSVSAAVAKRGPQDA